MATITSIEIEPMLNNTPTSPAASSSPPPTLTSTLPTTTTTTLTSTLPTTTTTTTLPPRTNTESVLWDAGRRFLMAVVTVVSIGLFIFHLFEFLNIQDPSKKSADWRVPLYGLASFAITTIGAVGFGKPYSPMLASMIGMGVLVVVCKVYPGMYDWMDKLVLTSTALVFLCEYYWKVYKSRRL